MAFLMVVKKRLTKWDDPPSTKSMSHPGCFMDGIESLFFHGLMTQIPHQITGVFKNHPHEITVKTTVLGPCFFHSWLEGGRVLCP